MSKTIKETVAVTLLVEIEHEGTEAARSEVIDELKSDLESDGWSCGIHVDHGWSKVGRSVVAAVRRTKARITRRGKVRP